MPFDFLKEGGWMAARLRFTNGLRFQHVKRPPARGQRALAFSRDCSTLRQIVEQAGLKRLQRLLLLAEEIRLRRVARKSLSRPPHRKRSERGRASGSEGMIQEPWTGRNEFRVKVRCSALGVAVAFITKFWSITACGNHRRTCRAYAIRATRVLQSS